MNSPTLPTAVEVALAFNTLPPPFGDPSLLKYDQAPWDRSSTGGFRNRLEGFLPKGLHNQVHNWVGKNMLMMTPPNDPVFFLHHCNVDRIWEGWMSRNGRVYAPDMTASAGLLGHRIDDPLISPTGIPTTPGQMLDMTGAYSYDIVP